MKNSSTTRAACSATPSDRLGPSNLELPERDSAGTIGFRRAAMRSLARPLDMDGMVVLRARRSPAEGGLQAKLDMETGASRAEQLAAVEADVTAGRKRQGCLLSSFFTRE